MTDNEQSPWAGVQEVAEKFGQVVLDQQKKICELDMRVNELTRGLALRQEKAKATPRRTGLAHAILLGAVAGSFAAAVVTGQLALDVMSAAAGVTLAAQSIRAVVTRRRALPPKARTVRAPQRLNR